MQVLKIICILGLAALITSCATSSYVASGNTDSLTNLQQLAPASKRATSEVPTDIRRQALQDAALGTGAQAGLAWRAQQIDDVLARNERALSRVFNFNAMLLDHSVLPPVLAEGRNTLNVDNVASLRLADRTYQIISQAHFVSAPPHWREYLWLNYVKPERPDNTLLPRNAAEKAIWKDYVIDGWRQGIEQANAIFSANLARLKRDYAGMILYRSLLAQNMVSPPFVAKSDLGITGDGTDLRVHDQILRITAMPMLQTNSKAWKAGISR